MTNASDENLNSRVDKRVDVIHGGLALGFPSITVRTDRRSVTAHISADHTLVLMLH